ncbi:hypothetical protein [Butyrivibrio sp. INlla16]|uniref:hypothetical protein n=1 Tax=Butyrivibrio sp. INlla16 TaxID=1520807 RepID=UPI000B8262CD|nr:hypothetical protein [Butyrivibrio sp. INlla16]
MLTVYEANGGTAEYFYEDGKLIADRDNNVFTKNAPGKEDAAPESSAEESVDITGTWYDPTGLDTVVFQFGGNGAGTLFWERGGESTPITYTVSGNTINITLTNSSMTLTYSGGKLSNGFGNTYIRE